MGGALFTVVVIVVVGGVVWNAKVRGERVNRAWSAAGQRLGLAFEPDTSWFFSAQQELRGQLQGVDIKIDVRSTGGEDNKQFTRYRVKHRPVGPDVKIKKQHSLSFIAGFFGRKDVLVGDPFFDERVVIDSSNTEAIRAFLTPTRRAAVLDLFATWPRGEFTQRGITVESRGIETDPSRLAQTALRLVEIAGIMGVDVIDAALTSQAGGDLGQAVHDLHVYNEQHDNGFALMLEAEALLDMGRHGEAALILEQVGRAAANDPTVEAWAQLAARPAPPPPPRPEDLYTPGQQNLDANDVEQLAPPSSSPFEPAIVDPALPSPFEPAVVDSAPPSPSPFEPARVDSAPSPEAPEFIDDSGPPDPPPNDGVGQEPEEPVSPASPAAGSGRASTSLDQQAVIDDLFDAERMSWEIVEYFETTYQNAQIEWTGELTSFHTYRHDLDFGDGPGIKATVLIGNVGRSQFISSDVHAMLQLGEDVELRRGTELRFRGVLTHVDRFARKVYVEYAQIY